jgi:hypothetical protein
VLRRELRRERWRQRWRQRWHSDGGSDGGVSGNGTSSNGTSGCGVSDGENTDGGPRTVKSMLSGVRGLCLPNGECRKVIVKLLRVGSARNMPLELKQECAAVRLLQFRLTAANSRRQSRTPSTWPTLPRSAL